MEHNLESLPGMIIVSGVAADTRLKDVEDLCGVARSYGAAATLVNPCYLNCTIKNTVNSQVKNYIAIGFPAGSDLTSVKVYAAKQSELMGADAVILMMNTGAFLSGNKKYTRHDLEAVRESVKATVGAAIGLECADKTAAAELAAKAGAEIIFAYFACKDEVSCEKATALRQVLGDDQKLMVPGGGKSASELLELAACGVDYFALGTEQARELLSEVYKELGKEPEEL